MEKAFQPKKKEMTVTASGQQYRPNLRGYSMGYVLSGG